MVSRPEESSAKNLPALGNARVEHDNSTPELEEEKDSQNGPLKEDSQETDFSEDCEFNDNPFEYSNRQLGTRIVGYVEIVVAVIQVALALVASANPAFVDRELSKSYYETQMLPRRFWGEIVIMVIRSVLTTACGVLLIFGAKRRCSAHCHVYLFINRFQLAFHYSYILVTVYSEDVYVALFILPEVFPSILFFWTVDQFLGELRYYEKLKENCVSTSVPNHDCLAGRKCYLTKGQ